MLVSIHCGLMNLLQIRDLVSGSLRESSMAFLFMAFSNVPIFSQVWDSSGFKSNAFS